jgi:hypothetical protein
VHDLWQEGCVAYHPELGWARLWVLARRAINSDASGRAKNTALKTLAHLRRQLSQSRQSEGETYVDLEDTAAERSRLLRSQSKGRDRREQPPHEERLIERCARYVALAGL